MSASLVQPVSPSTASVGARDLISRLVRWSTAASLAVLITFALFMVMQVLIRVEVIALPEPRPVDDFTISEYVPPVTLEPRTPPVLEAVSPPPATPVMITDRSDLPSEAGPVFHVAPARAEPNIASGLAGMIIAPPPIEMRVPPIYPAREQERGITGTCTIRYDILASGRTVNAQATQCDTIGFARASLAAVERWRHQTVLGVDPNRVVNRGVETTLVFDLED